MKNIIFVRIGILALVFVLVCTFVCCKDDSSAISENETLLTEEDVTTSDIQDDIYDDNAILENTYTEQTKLENQVELTEENLLTTWEMFVAERNYYIVLYPYNKMTYGCMITGTLYHIFMIDGKYSISGNKITFYYHFQGKDYTETYNIALSKEFLILSPIENGATTLLGMYANENYDATTENE